MATAAESARSRDDAEDEADTLYRLAVAYVALAVASGAVPNPDVDVASPVALAALALARGLIRSTPARYGTKLPEDLPGASVADRAAALAPDMARTAVEHATQHYNTVAERIRRSDPEATPEAIVEAFTADTPWQRAAARTAATRLSAETALSMVEDVDRTAGVPHRVLWISRGDTKVRTSHRRLHGKTRAPGTAFKVWPDGRQLSFPGDPRAPLDESINCRCSLLLVPESAAWKATDVISASDADFLAASAAGRQLSQAEQDLIAERS